MNFSLVGDCEFRKAKSPAILETTGQGPCLGICIYHPPTKSGYLGHMHVPQVNPTWSELMNKIRRTYRRDLGKLEVTLTGLSPDNLDEKCLESYVSNRKFVVDYLLQRGFKSNKIKKKFNEEGDVGIITVFDLRTGTVSIKKIDDES